MKVAGQLNTLHKSLAAAAPEVAAGKDALVSSVVKGKGAMPPKAGASDLKDDDIKAAVDCMLASVK